MGKWRRSAVRDGRAKTGRPSVRAKRISQSSWTRRQRRKSGLSVPIVFILGSATNCSGLGYLEPTDSAGRL
uniref:Uncharacterized protein n=1 Tax=Physcomitrium patens TaxID=3218 RepID=A0A7I3ZLP6_PHYPA